MTTESNPIDKNALGLAVGCYMAWGIFPIYWKLLTHIPAMETLMHRIIWSFVFYIIIMAVITVIRGKRFFMPVSRKEWGICLITSLLMAINWGVFIYAVNVERVIEASLAYFINPLMSVAVGVVIFREPFPKLLKIAFILATIGVGIQIILGNSFPWIALVLAISFCIYGAFKKVVKTEATQFSMMESAIILVPALIGASYLRDVSETALTTAEWWLLAGGGIVTGIPLLLFAMAAQRLPYSVMGMLQFIGPSLQFMIALWLYKEPMNPIGWLSFLFIWGGVGVYLADRIRVARKLRKASKVPLATPEQPR